MKLNDQERLQRYERRAGWYGDIPEGHYAILDPHDPAAVTSWRVKNGRLTPWPKEARNGPVLLRRDVPRGRDEAKAVREAHWSAVADYREVVEIILGSAPELHAARYAATTFRCTICNRPLTTPESNAYAVGPECRSWMPEGLLAEYARQVSLVRSGPAAGTAPDSQRKGLA